MKIKTAQLIDGPLDWAVALARDESIRVERGRVRFALSQFTNDYDLYSPSTDWTQGGPIIDQENLCVGRKHQADTNYCAVNDPAIDCWARTAAGGYLSYGPTPLIAAMRCFCRSKLGDEVDVPEELL